MSTKKRQNLTDQGDLTEHELRALNSKTARAVRDDEAFRALLLKAHPDRVVRPDVEH